MFGLREMIQVNLDVDKGRYFPENSADVYRVDAFNYPWGIFDVLLMRFDHCVDEDIFGGFLELEQLLILKLLHFFKKLTDFNKLIQLLFLQFARFDKNIPHYAHFVQEFTLYLKSNFTILHFTQFALIYFFANFR